MRQIVRPLVTAAAIDAAAASGCTMSSSMTGVGAWDANELNMPRTMRLSLTVSR